MIPQKKALILSFKMTPWKWMWHYQEGTMTTCCRNFFCPTQSYAFHGKETWCPHDHARPSNFQSPKSWVSELSSHVSFVSALLMVPSEYWKRLEENFRDKIISSNSQNDENYKNIFPPVFFNILKEPLVCSTETNDTSNESSDTQLFGAGKFEGVAKSRGSHASLLKKAYFFDFL